MGWSEEASQKLYGWYGFLVYLLPVGGGYLADRFIGTHRAMVIGGVIIACGHFSLAFHGETTFFLGPRAHHPRHGFFKAERLDDGGQLYREDDPRRDGGFTIFYMGINLGALVGPLVCGGLARARASAGTGASAPRASAWSSAS